jgi:hypothetical protein
MAAYWDCQMAEMRLMVTEMVAYLVEMTALLMGSVMASMIQMDSEKVHLKLKAVSLVR